MKYFIHRFSHFVLSTLLLFSATAQQNREILQLENPITIEYLHTNLLKSSPKLVLNSTTESILKSKIKTDPVIQNMYKAIELNSEKIIDQPFLERVVTGRRLLSVSREMLYRANMLGMVYRMEGTPEILERINNELIAVCNFQDWNPSHFLDAAEMALAVALALDWTGDDLPQSTVELAKTALIKKGLEPSYDENHWWINSNNNWNQVCHAGMIAAAIIVAEDEPELAVKTIHRALDNMHYALEEYGPDGVYPEGSTYWGYGTSFTVLTAAMFESAFGRDFGLAAFPGLMESATFRVLSNAPSGMYYNFADCGDRRSRQGDITLAWFAAKTGNTAFFEKERFLLDPKNMGTLSRIAGAGLVWLARYKEKSNNTLPSAWKGDGANPIVIFTGGENDPNQYYFGGKGGRGTVNHGNMDAGSFIFELDGVRWVIDPGNQPYHELEKTGFDLWNSCQDCQRWTLLTKNNFGHSTLTVNGQLHKVDGLAVISDFKKGMQPEATIDLTPAFGGLLKEAIRRFVQTGPRSIQIEDHIELSEDVEMITWQLMTQAQVDINSDGALLNQDDKHVKLEIISPSKVHFSVVSLDPPPLKLDRRIEHLKRIELRIPAYLFENQTGIIAVKLSGE